MPARISHPDRQTTQVRVPIEASRTATGLGRALAELSAAAARFPRALGKNDDGDVPPFLLVTLHGDGKWLSERRFFERCVDVPALRPKVAEYIALVSPAHWPTDPFRGAGFWTSIDLPAGALAAVPLALADASYVDTAIAHLRGADLDHETFQRAFIAELVRKYGLTDSTLRVVAFRAVDGQGQHGMHDLHWLMTRGGLRQHLAKAGGLEDFAALVHRVSKRKSFRSLYVANAGRGLFLGEPARFSAWIACFEKRGLAFEPHERVLGEARSAWTPGPWPEAWDAAASCTDRD